MESSLAWIRELAVNLKKVYDAVLSDIYGLPVIRNLMGNFTDPNETIAHKLENLNIDLTPIENQLNEIEDKIDHIDIDTSDLAKEDTLTAGISDIRHDISEIEIDTSDLAKEDNATSNKEEILDAIQNVEVDLTPIEERLDYLIDIFDGVTYENVMAELNHMNDQDDQKPG